jgi:hypothetical protein
LVGDNGLLASLKLRVHAPLRSRLGYGLQRIRQAQAVSDRLHGELSGERVVRTSFRQYLDDWFDGKKAETARFAMTFYRTGLAKFLQVSRQAHRLPCHLPTIGKYLIALNPI